MCYCQGAQQGDTSDLNDCLDFCYQMGCSASYCFSAYGPQSGQCVGTCANNGAPCWTSSTCTPVNTDIGGPGDGWNPGDWKWLHKMMKYSRWGHSGAHKRGGKVRRFRNGGTTNGSCPAGYSMSSNGVCTKGRR
tara:strand:+ start:1281 stop:1682 length:402 start_codon:yes stop_codon:yes gene_type:complete